MTSETTQDRICRCIMVPKFGPAGSIELHFSNGFPPASRGLLR